MSNIKYTTDGRKVVVIGDLNQTEKIVQEIFVTEDGCELPSGERFVVKSLLDQPAESWKEKKLKELEDRYEKESKDWERKLNNLQEEKRITYDSLSARVKWLKSVAKEPHGKGFKEAVETLSLFFSNCEKWVFVSDYNEWYLDRFDKDGVNKLFDEIERSSFGVDQFDRMRLISLFGKSDGSLQYRVNSYSDGSGNDKNVEFFKSKEDALKYAQNKINELKCYSNHNLKFAEKWVLKINETIVNKDKENRKKQLNQYIAERKRDIEEYENSLRELGL